MGRKERDKGVDGKEEGRLVGWRRKESKKRTGTRGTQDEGEPTPTRATVTQSNRQRGTRAVRILYNLNTSTKTPDPFVLDEITSKPEQLQSQSTAQMRRFICCISGAKYCGGDERKSRRASIGEMSFLLRCRRKAQSESVELALPALVPSASSDASRPAKSGIDSNKKQTNTSPTHLQPPPSPELHQRTHKALVS